MKCSILSSLLSANKWLLAINNIKRLIHDIFHIGPGISPRLPYQARQRSWRADMGRGLITGTMSTSLQTRSNVIDSVQIDIV
jgi:hypothetical protein